jgi:peptide/nickel transport system permease protein
MVRYALRRLLRGGITVWLITLLIFVLLRLGGNPIEYITAPSMTQGNRERLERIFGFDKPIPVQYVRFVGNMVKGEFGPSIRWGYRDASNVVMMRVPATVRLVGTSLVFSMVVGLALGILAATRAGTTADRVVRVLAIAGQSMPAYSLGLLLILVFSVHLKWLPSAGGVNRVGLKALIMPSITIAWFLVSANARLVRSALLDALDSDYVLLLRARGLPERIVVWKHALKNAALPVLNLFAVNFAYSVGGAVVTEAIFAWPGIGRLLVEAIFARDFTVVQAIVFFTSILIVLANVLVDLAHAWLDPRIRLE